MGYDGKRLRRALEQKRAQRDARQEAQAKQREMIYARVPRLREIDRQLRGTMFQIIREALAAGGDPTKAVEALQVENQTLQEEQRRLLLQNGYAADALEETPACPLCGDTGFQGTEPCSCVKELYAQEQNRELSKLLDLGAQTFDTFSFAWYSPHPWPGKSVSPQANMELIFEICRGYAVRFPDYEVQNLFLSGGPGLGKTFLSACIAKTVSNRGYSVVYDTAVQILEQFEAQKFSRDSDGEARDETNRYLNCDLLIMDDLGSELVTPFVQSALYMLLNHRMDKGYHTVISSNLSLEEIKSRYVPSIYSRIAGRYQALFFYGEDIRLQKKQKETGVQQR
ncbi:MAG: ATP-binding protein [Oscillospiraceae bacterium]|nr:ATP-binding protein [Oscillospiraceae bacterium]